MKCVRCKTNTAMGRGVNCCIACVRQLVHRRYWPELVKKAGKK